MEISLSHKSNGYLFLIKILSKGNFALRNFKNSGFSNSNLSTFKIQKASKVLQKKNHEQLNCRGDIMSVSVENRSKPVYAFI